MRSVRVLVRRAGRPRSFRLAHDGRQNVLLTGAGGLIGGILRRGLGEEYAIHGLDVVRGDGVGVVADVRRLRQIAPAVKGMDAVVDLAANAHADASWDVVRENNIAAAIGVLEAAREAGVRRVVLASSNHVVGMYEQDEPYASVLAGRYDGLDPAALPRLLSDVPVRPDGPYAIGKALTELAGRYYAEAHGLSVICLRIGTVMGRDRPTRPRHFATLISHRDLVRLVRCCLEAPPSLGYAVLYGVSANTWRIWDLDEARAAIGFEPVDDAEQWRGVESP
jgi:uronate dehydrogenase